MRRLGAIFYDSLLLGGLLFAATACLLPFNEGEAIAPDRWLFPAYLLLVSYFFFAWFWTHGGQTLGMRAWKIRVASFSGEPITWSQATTRFTGALISWAAAGIGFLWIVFNKEKNGWHDLLSRSRIDWMNSSFRE